MMTKTIEKKDYLGKPICKGQKEDGKCPKFDVNSEKECPDNWSGETDWKTNMPWECEEIIETETVNVMAGGEGKKKGRVLLYGQNEARELLEVQGHGLQSWYLL